MTRTRASENNVYYTYVYVYMYFDGNTIPKMYILKSVYFIMYTLVFPSYPQWIS